MQIPLFIGRFQPFHKGHIDAIKQILSENKILYLAIGSTNNVGTERNPLDIKIRLKLIIKSLKKEKIVNINDDIDIINLGSEGIDLGNIKIFLVPDFNDDVKWKKYIVENIPDFDIVYSGTNETLSYFKDSHKVKLLKINIPISATIIRKKIKEDNIDWKKWTYLDTKSAEFIKGS